MRIEDNVVYGTVGWENENEDDDKQDFKWEIRFDEKMIVTKKLCDFLNQHNLVDVDKIMISPNQLIEKLIKSGWNEIDAEISTEFLDGFSVRMVDEGEESDTFFIHY
jgi:hypothetical protein